METSALASEIRMVHLQVSQLREDPEHVAKTSELLLYVIDQNEDNAAFLAENRQWQYDLLRLANELVTQVPVHKAGIHQVLDEHQTKTVTHTVMDLHWRTLYMLLQGIWNGGHGTKQLVGSKIEYAARALSQGMTKASSLLPQPPTATNALVMRTQAMRIAKFAGMIDERRPLGDWAMQQNQALLELVYVSIEVVGYMLGALGVTFQDYSQMFLNRKPFIQE
jgi:hypothetical protein